MHIVKEKKREKFATDDLPMIAIIYSSWHEDVIEKLLQGALNECFAYGLAKENISFFKVPGAFEIPQMVEFLCTLDKLDGIVTLGCIVKGETPHFDVLSRVVTEQLLRTACDTDIPVGLGVLTVDNLDQAIARAGGTHGNKGAEAASAMIEMLQWYDQLIEANMMDIQHTDVEHDEEVN